MINSHKRNKQQQAQQKGVTVDEMITTSEAGQLLGVSGQTVRRLVHGNKLVAMRTEGNQIRISKNSVEKYIQSRLIADNSQHEIQQ